MPLKFGLPLAVTALLALAGCGVFSAPPAAATPQPAGAGLACSATDHGLTDRERGWGFCYPSTWRFVEKVQPSDQPHGVDTTFDVTDYGVTSAEGPGLYGFMIIGTYARGGSATLRDWLDANVDPKLATQPITWGNAADAAYAPSLSTRYALTDHQVVELVLQSGSGNLDLDSAMGSRLSSWKFSY